MEINLGVKELRQLKKKPFPIIIFTGFHLWTLSSLAVYDQQRIFENSSNEHRWMGHMLYPISQCQLSKGIFVFQQKGKLMYDWGRD